MELAELFARLGAALGVGLLVGLQRERAQSTLAGIRTFALIALLGALCGVISVSAGAWVLAAGLLSVAGLAVIGNLHREPGAPPPGVTTEAAMLVVFCAGALAMTGSIAVAAAVGAGCAVLLHLKESLHGFVRGLDERDVRAIMLFAAMSLVILPVVPDRAMGPFSALNPRHLWLMVVLVVGISLGGYVAYRVLGHGRGSVVGALLGGLVSSTATTAAFARRTQGSASAAVVATMAILVASTVLGARVLAEVYVVSPGLLERLAPPLGALLVVTLAMAVIGALRCTRDPADLAPMKNPTELRSALVFAGLFAAVLVASAAASRWFGGAGLYVVAGISGLTDMDAITLSSAGLARDGLATPQQAGTAIVIALISNTIFKTGLAGALGGATLLKRLAVPAAVIIGAAVVVIVAWLPAIDNSPVQRESAAGGSPAP